MNCCEGKGVEANLANPTGICMQCGSQRFGVDQAAQMIHDEFGLFLVPNATPNHNL